MVDLASAVSARLGAVGHSPVAGTIDGHPFEGRLAPARGGGHRLYVDAAMRRATGKDAGDSVILDDLRVDLGRPDPDLPEELARSLDDRPGGWEEFERLPEGLRRQVLAYVQGGKRSTTRLNRCQQVLANLDERRARGL